MEKKKKDLTDIDVKLPLAVIHDKRLSNGAMLMYGMICGLSRNDGCFASNCYLAQLMHIDSRSVQRLLSQLKDCGYITVTLDNSGEDKPRRIKPIGPRSKRAGEIKGDVQEESLCDADAVQRITERSAQLPPMYRSRWNGVPYEF